jgi:hypothetical protein
VSSCTRLYNGALVVVCDQGLFGLVVMLLSASLCALLFTVLVWCNSHTWIYFKHKGKYVKVRDGFMVWIRLCLVVNLQGPNPVKALRV